MGGGQPRSKDPDVKTKRLSGLYTEDESKVLRKSHENPFVQSLYKDYLGEPGGHISHELLHTHYVKRGIFNELFGVDYSIEPEPSQKRKSGSEAPKAATRDEQAQTNNPKFMEFAAENSRLKAALEDANETVEILKSLLKTK